MNDSEKIVAVIASGETERRALPHLTKHLSDQGITVQPPLIPPNNGALKAEMVAKLIQSDYHMNLAMNLSTPHKYVVLVDVDGKEPDEVLPQFRNNVPMRLEPELRSKVLYAYARWHLEAWYFADSRNLRNYFGGRALGHIDTTRPDEIQNPKLHLKNLLGDSIYTARISEDIAQQLDARTISQRSPSFGKFLDAVNNGG